MYDKVCKALTERLHEAFHAWRPVLNLTPLSSCIGA